MSRHRGVCALLSMLLIGPAVLTAQSEDLARYENRLTPIANPAPILADWPQYVEPIEELRRFEAPPVVVDERGDLAVRGWRFSYNARGIVEVENRINSHETAVIVVHPWGIDDGQGWQQPDPAGVALFCTPEKNEIYRRHIREVVNPFLKRMRDDVAVVGYSLPGAEDPIRKQMYRGYTSTPDAQERAAGARQLQEHLAAFKYEGGPLKPALDLPPDRTLAAYFRAFPGLDSGDYYNAPGYWDLPIPVVSDIEVAPGDVVIYDGLGYPALRDFLKSQGVRHVLLTGYATDMCLCSTTAGFENLAPDFNVFVVGDATLATFPACDTPRFATQTALAKAALSHLVTQVSWVRSADTSAGK